MDRKAGSTAGKVTVSVLVAVALLAGAGPARAALSLDYTLGSGNPQALIYYNPSQDLYLHGSNIAVTQISGSETALNAGPAGALNVSGGTLNFVTGAYSGTAGNTIDFAGGGTLSITGGLTALSLGEATLLSGSFTSATLTTLPLLGEVKFDIFGATLSAVDNPLIYSYFNIPAGSGATQGMSISFLATAAGNGGQLSSSLYGGTIVDLPTSTPIPAAAWLFGSGLLGLVRMHRKV